MKGIFVQGIVNSLMFHCFKLYVPVSKMLGLLRTQAKLDNFIRTGKIINIMGKCFKFLILILNSIESVCYPESIRSGTRGTQPPVWPNPQFRPHAQHYTNRTFCADDTRRDIPVVIHRLGPQIPGRWGGVENGSHHREYYTTASRDKHKNALGSRLVVRRSLIKPLQPLISCARVSIILYYNIALQLV